MPKIVITEQDLTTPGTLAEDFDVVYIPGLVDINQSTLYNEDGDYIGLEVNKPTLFTSVKDFESLCGTKGVIFKKDQRYADVADSVTGIGFTADAVPYHGVLFEAGTVDPSYVMAKELLDAGLCVLYERINGKGQYEDVLSIPDDWDTNYTDYCVVEDAYAPIKQGTAPAFTGDYVAVEPEYDEKNMCYVAPKFNKDLTYYTIETDADGNTVYEAFEKAEAEAQPEDWDNNYAQYYTKCTTVYFALDESIVADAKDWSFVTDSKGNVVKIKIDDEINDDLTLYMIPEQDKPKDWYKTFNKYYTKTNTYVPIEKTLTAPEFDSKAKYAIFNDSCNAKAIYKALSGVYSVDGYEGLQDLGNYSVKYLTSGGYPVYEYQGNTIVTKMLALAEKRGDCVAIIDHTDNPGREKDIARRGSLYFVVNTDDSLAGSGEYGTMFTPWATYNRTTVDKEVTADGVTNTFDDSDGIRMAASFAYLLALADSIKTNAPWLAVAGATRGVVPNLAQGGMTTIIPNGAADAMQPRTDGTAVNAITDIKPYGNVIWGNRTLKHNAENLVATSFLNVRNLVSDVKKVCYRAARKLTFEQNNDVLWVNFKAAIAPTLDRMKSGYGISGYKFVRDTAHEMAAEKATVCAKIILYPVYPVEDFYITIVLKDGETTVE